MANFMTHALGATGAGVVAAGASLALFGLNGLAFAGASLVAGFVGGLLPDIDHDEAIPIREVFSLVAAVVPAAAMPYLARKGLSTEATICFFAITYISIRFIGAEVFKRLTSHRGIFHSIPFVIVAGEVVAVALVEMSAMERVIIGGAVSLGAFTHLALDELFAVDFTGRRLKKSFGTAIKLWSSDLLPTLLCYGALLVATVALALSVLPGLLPGPGRH
jgi:membrane-bound metal-dependent hydrolase YbcI (DUF457 family)